MGFRILYTEEALTDLEAILDHISTDDPEAASRFGNALLNHVDLLASFPHIGSRTGLRPGVRKILHTPVRVYYRVDDRRGLIEILHFWHVSRRQPDWL